jgi:hypothetical protein
VRQTPGLSCVSSKPEPRAHDCEIVQHGHSLGGSSLGCFRKLSRPGAQDFQVFRVNVVPHRSSGCRLPAGQSGLSRGDGDPRVGVRSGRPPRCRGHHLLRGATTRAEPGAPQTDANSIANRRFATLQARRLISQTRYQARPIAGARVPGPVVKLIERNMIGIAEVIARGAALDELNTANTHAHCRVAFHAWPSLGRGVLQTPCLPPLPRRDCFHFWCGLS